MIKIKKGILIFLIVLALVCGISIPVTLSALNVYDVSSLFGKKEADETYTLSKAEFERYQNLTDRYTKLDMLRNYITANYYTDVDESELDTWTYKGLFYGLDDPYSGYLTESEYEQVMISTTGEYSGIGVTITANDDGYIEVVAPTDDTPAYRAGIKSGDLIVTVDGTDYSGAELDVAAARMRGKAGTDVSITIYRNGEYIDLTITRENIISVTVKHEMLEDGIGYIRISSFEENTSRDFAAALKDIEDQGAKGLVIDIRDNGGGLVNSCVSIADQLMDKATVAYTEDNQGQRDFYRTKDGKTDLPFVILVNGGSASASEILACGIQDNAAGKIVGTQSYGKGIIQSLDRLPDGSAVKLTILQYFSPSGNVIHKQGVTPDCIVELNEDCYDEEGNLVDDLQLKKALELLR